MLTRKTSHKWPSVLCLLAALLAGLLAPAGSPLQHALSPSVQADSTPQTLPFSQNWSSTGLITTDDNWSGVPGIVGFRGDDLTTVTATDPQTILADGSGTPVDVIANQANPNTQATGGVAEFDGIANPVVALQGSGTADAPHLVININTTGMSGVHVAYNLRDIDGSADNAVQPVALQFRVGSTGNYTNIPAGFVADATTGPSLATLVTPVSVTLPAAADNQPLVQLRIMTTNAVGNDEWVGIDDLLIAIPSEAKLDSFTAKPLANGKVLLEWRTGFETDNLGFNLYSEVRGKRTRINPQMLAGSALRIGEGTKLRAGCSYAWADASPGGKDVRYWLEAIDLYGQSTLFGPIALDRSQAGDGRALEGRRALALSNLGNPAAGATATLPLARTATIAAHSASQVAAQAELASGPRIKLTVTEEGWYRVTQPELLGAGLAPDVDPRNLQLFAEGREQAILVRGEADGHFDSADAIEFYGLGLNTPATKARIYWLVAGSQTGRRITLEKGRAKRAAPSGFAYTVERRDRTVYFSNLRNGDAENFFGAVIARDPVDQVLTLARVDAASNEDGLLEINLQGVTGVPHRVGVRFNGSELGEVVFSSLAPGSARLAVPRGLIREGQNTVTLTSAAGVNDVSLVDSIRMTYRHAYAAADNQLRFTLQNKQRATIDGFTSPDARVVDVSDPEAPREVRTSVEAGAGGYQITMGALAGGDHLMLAFADNQVKRPAAIAADTASALKDASQSADLVIITRRDFFAALAPLVEWRQHQNLNVVLVDIEDVYDEFNFGERSPQAVKDFLAYAKSSWAKAPRAVMLVGDASYDPKNYLGQGDWDIVPTKLLDTIMMETASDDWLADFDGDRLPELAVGRLPARSAGDVSLMVSKLIDYDRGSTSDNVLFISDSNDGINFEFGNTELRLLVPAGKPVEEIVRGRLDDSATSGQIVGSLNRAPRIVNYFGHGSIDLWRGKLLTTSAARELANGSPSTFFLITCLNGYFQDPAVEGLSESLMLAEHGGAVAVWASSSLCGADTQLLMDLELFRQVFNSSGEPLTLGDATRRAKAATDDQDVRASYIVFGDPTMRLR